MQSRSRHGISAGPQTSEHRSRERSTLEHDDTTWTQINSLRKLRAAFLINVRSRPLEVRRRRRVLRSRESGVREGSRCPQQVKHLLCRAPSIEVNCSDKSSASYEKLALNGFLPIVGNGLQGDSKFFKSMKEILTWRYCSLGITSVFHSFTSTLLNI